MRINLKITLGIIITLVIFLISTTVIREFFKGYTFTSMNTILTLSSELILSIIAIKFFKTDFNIKLPKFKSALKVFFTGFGVAIITMMIMNIIEMLITGHNLGEGHPIMNSMTIVQVFFLVFIGASIAEEFLFRGFLLNMLSSLKTIKLKIFKKEIGLHIIISGLMFGLAHLGLLMSGSSFNFVLKIIIFATVLGWFAGYFQEKYKNTSYAILTHMGANLMGVLGMVLMQYIPL